MLQVSDSARHLLDWIRVDRELPESIVCRLVPDPETTIDGVDASLEFAEQPAEDDEVTERFGTRLYVAAELVDELSDRVMDVERNPQGFEILFRHQDEFNLWDRGRKGGEGEDPPPGTVPGVG